MRGPLLNHFSRTIEIARFLLDQGAEIDALDDDHDSTQAQHLIGDRPEVAGFLVAQGARWAAALGDVVLMRRHFDADPRAITVRIDQDWFPMIDTAPNGGYLSMDARLPGPALDVARKRGHGEILDRLRKRAGRLTDCLLRSAAARMAPRWRACGRSATDGPRAAKGVASALNAARNNVPAVLLRRGFPVTGLSQHGGMGPPWIG